MVKDITHTAIRRMQAELDQLEAQGKCEVKDASTHAMGLLRVDLVRECRRRLFFIATTIPKEPDVR